MNEYTTLGWILGTSIGIVVGFCVRWAMSIPGMEALQREVDSLYHRWDRAEAKIKELHNLQVVSENCTATQYRCAVCGSTSYREKKKEWRCDMCDCVVGNGGVVIVDSSSNRTETGGFVGTSLRCSRCAELFRGAIP